MGPVRVKHLCHFPGCRRAVPPRLWGCLPHWRLLPDEIKHRITRAYVKGQEIRKDPSAEYVAAAQEARAWCLAYERMLS